MYIYWNQLRNIIIYIIVSVNEKNQCIYTYWNQIEEFNHIHNYKWKELMYIYWNQIEKYVHMHNYKYNWKDLIYIYLNLIVEYNDYIIMSINERNQCIYIHLN